MEKTAELILDGKTCKLPIVEGSEMLHPTIRWHIELARHIVKTY